MESNLEFLTIIPARSGSKRLPNKNLLPFAGRPLIDWTLDLALKSNLIKHIHVSTDSKEIVAHAKGRGINVEFLRPPSLSEDEARMESVIQHCIDEYQERERFFTHVILLQPTSPLRTLEQLEGAINLFTSNAETAGLISFSYLPSSLHPRKIFTTSFDESKRLLRYCDSVELELSNRSSFPIRNGPAIYLTEISALSQGTYRSGMICFPMPWVESVDIDTFEDFFIAESIMLRKMALG